MTGPNKDAIFPLNHHKKLCFLKNIVKNPNIIVGDYSYYDDFEDVYNFEKNVKYHFDFLGDQLIIGKFCMIASDVEFIMNGGNHLTEAISAYPFAIFNNGWESSMDGKSYPHKGNTIIGNDVWLGYKSTILPGITIGDGAIIAAHTVVTKDVPPYSVVGGNPGKIIRRRFSEPSIEILLKLKWWDWPIEKITQHVKLLSSDNVSELSSLI
ncbi:CatB-related O-acetyltransferase [Membranihabitans marinus]|uniref:CatB-related O-acetyltransferase n=1 Tax=Membranihabitans marinus TaxID=1227546 RepID=UPI001F330BE0|nr:CatB-related O-acetyltransferase [Membranihabitans marinus]